MTRVYTLYRVSTVGQVDHDDIPMQRIACHEFAQQQGDWEIVNELYEKGVSGYKVSTDKRDAISQLKVDALAGKFDVLLVFMFDRLGRRDDETPFVVQWFVAHGIRVWSVKEGEQRFDNHVDKLLNYIRFWQASGESEKTSIRIREKQTQMTIAGEYHGGMVPFGFDAICTGRANKKGQPVKDLVRNEAEAAIKAELYHKVVDEGYGLHRLANWLNEQGIKTKRGTTLWRNTSVRAMIGNPIDRGQMHSGDVLSEPFEHLRIIDDYYFYKAVEIIRGRASTKREGPLRTDIGGLLTGMIYCGECGERLTINHCRKVTDTLEGPREYRWSVYRCYRKINSRKTCTGQSTYNAKRIDEAVLSIVRSFFARITTLPEAAQMQAAMQRENLIREKAIQTAEDDVEKATKALSALEDEALKTLSGESKLTLDTISKLIEKQKAKQTDARMKLQALLEEKQTDDEKFKAKQEQLQRTKEWAQILDIATPPRKQMILAEIIDRVEVRRGYEITVKFKLTAQQFLDPNGCEAISKIAS